MLNVGAKLHQLDLIRNRWSFSVLLSHIYITTRFVTLTGFETGRTVSKRVGRFRNGSDGFETGRPAMKPGDHHRTIQRLASLPPLPQQSC